VGEAIVRMQTKVYAFLLALFGGFIAIPFLTDSIALAAAWVLLLAPAQLFLFRCPACGALAVIGKHGVGTPTVGSQCRQCGKEY